MQSQPVKPRRMVPLSSVLVVLGLVVVIGFVHIVHGGGVGLDVCAKDGWSIGDTFVDVDDYIGKPLISMLDRPKIVRAMIACELLRLPDGFNPEREKGPRASSLFNQSKEEITKIKLKQYANDAFLSWSTSNPGKACPGKLVELLCPPPAGAKGIGLISMGFDGKEGTADDLKSWE